MKFTQYMAEKKQAEIQMIKLDTLEKVPLWSWNQLIFCPGSSITASDGCFTLTPEKDSDFVINFDIFHSFLQHSMCDMLLQLSVVALFCLCCELTFNDKLRKELEQRCATLAFTPTA